MVLLLFLWARCCLALRLENLLSANSQQLDLLTPLKPVYLSQAVAFVCKHATYPPVLLLGPVVALGPEPNPSISMLAPQRGVPDKVLWHVSSQKPHCTHHVMSTYVRHFVHART